MSTQLTTFEFLALFNALGWFLLTGFSIYRLAHNHLQDAKKLVYILLSIVTSWLGLVYGLRFLGMLTLPDMSMLIRPATPFIIALILNFVILDRRDQS